MNVMGELSGDSDGCDVHEHLGELYDVRALLGGLDWVAALYWLLRTLIFI